jgi:hypothetical protein
MRVQLRWWCHRERDEFTEVRMDQVPSIGESVIDSRGGNTGDVTKVIWFPGAPSDGYDVEVWVNKRVV